MHRKKSLTFHSALVKDLCSRNYGIRLAKGRRQMVLTPQVLQGFVDFETSLSWYDSSLIPWLSTNWVPSSKVHVTWNVHTRRCISSISSLATMGFTVDVQTFGIVISDHERQKQIFLGTKAWECLAECKNQIDQALKGKKEGQWIIDDSRDIKVTMNMF